MDNLYDKEDLRKIERLAIEYGRLLDWFEKDYPEATIRLEVNNDKRLGVLNYKLSILTGKEATPDNQGFFQSSVTITRSRFLDIRWMDDFASSLYEKYKDTITRAMNDHYNTEREKNVS